MSLEEQIAAAVEGAVARAVAPLTAEIARLRELEEDRGITKAEAAKRLGVSVRTVEREIKAGRIQAMKVGGSTRVPLSALLTRAA